MATKPKPMPSLGFRSPAALKPLPKPKKTATEQALDQPLTLLHPPAPAQRPNKKEKEHGGGGFWHHLGEALKPGGGLDTAAWKDVKEIAGSAVPLGKAVAGAVAHDVRHP